MGAKRLSQLSAHFDGDLSAILAADVPTLCQVPGIGAHTAAAIRTIHMERAEAQIARWTRAGVRIVTRHDADYPAPLTRLTDAPPTLFIRQTLPNPFTETPDPRETDLEACLSRICIGVVGTRQPSDAGAFAARAVGDAVGRGGGTVVSGFALGVDWLAHGGAIINGGRSIAVLGSGVLNIYPPEHRASVIRFIARGGVFMSEVAPDARPSSAALIARNRIISGLSRAVILVESNADGGALHTVRFARAQGVPVYALDLDATGNRALIAEGTRIVTLDTMNGLAWLESLDPVSYTPQII